jgi:hypothetical protein
LIILANWKKKPRKPGNPRSKHSSSKSAMKRPEDD